MRHNQLYNNQKAESKSVVSTQQNSLSGKSDIRDGMTTSQIANVISNQLVLHVSKALDNVKKK